MILLLSFHFLSLYDFDIFGRFLSLLLDNIIPWSTLPFPSISIDFFTCHKRSIPTGDGRSGLCKRCR